MPGRGVSPPVDPSRPPRFEELNEAPRKFERLSARLMRTDHRIRGADLYGINGRRQFGVDVVARRNLDSATEVASCKCYEQVRPGDLRGWTDDFLKHWDTHWRQYDVRRFILITAASNITATENEDQIRVEASRFARLGIEYEVWGPEQLTDRLQHDRHTTQRFLGSYWAEVLCGSTEAVRDHLASLQRAISGQVRSRIFRAREWLRTGDHAAVTAFTAEMHQAEIWTSLSAEAQADVLRLQGSLALVENDVEQAIALANQAQTLAPAEPRLLANAIERRDGAAAALEILGNAASRPARQDRVKFLVILEQLDEAKALAEILQAEDPTDAETLRLLSFIHLHEGRREEAYTAMLACEALAPDWLGVKRIGAVVRYARALSPALGSTWTMTPNPVSPHSVRIDDTAQQDLAIALQLFGQLRASRQVQATDRCWPVACLANLVGREAEAAELAKAILSETPCEPLAIAWTVAREWDIDLAASKMALIKKVEDAQADSTDVQALSWILLQESGPEETARALAPIRDRLTGEARDQAEEVIAYYAGIDNPANGEPSGAELDRALQLAREAEDWTHVEQELATLFGGDLPQPAALSFAQAVADRRRWSALEPHLDQIASIGTAAAVVLATHIIHHTDSSEHVCEFLAANASAFPGSRLPAELRRIEIIALARLGRLPEALALAHSLSVETGIQADRLSLAQLHLSSGNTQAAIPIASAALDELGLEAAEALRFSVAFGRDDVDLARRLWRYALAQGVPENLVLVALAHGFKLGLDKEMAPLMLRVHARAEAGAEDVWTGTLDDVVEQMRSYRERQQDLGDQFERGALPVHLLAGAINFSLGHAYRLDRPGLDSGGLYPLLLRHGGRPLAPRLPGPWSSWTVHLDVTALLLADQLELLDHLEALESPVVISPHLPDILYKVEQDASHHQLSVVAAGRLIIEARAESRLRIQEASAGNEVAVRHDGDLSGSGPTLGDLRRTLAAHGDVSLSDEQEPAEPIVATGTRLLFPGNTLQTLASEGLLDHLLRRFVCLIPIEAFQRTVAEVQTAAAGDAVAERIRLLRLRVARGRERGVYTSAPRHNPVVSDGDADFEGEAEGSSSFLFDGLLDLFLAPGENNAVVWIDDRHISGYVHAEGKPVVGIVEVLNALRAEGRLDPETWRRKLIQLRAAGAAFIPLAIDEVMVPLRAAPLRNGRVIETPDLAILRRNFAAALRLDPKLKIGDSDLPNLAGRPDETPFLQAARQFVERALEVVWKDDAADLETRRAWSDWLWSSLRVEQFTRPLPADDPGQGNELLASLLLAGLMADAMRIWMGSLEASLVRQGEFLAWLEERALAERGGSANERFFDMVATQLKSLLLGNVSQQPDAAHSRAARRYLQHLMDRLPAAIRDRLLVHEEFARVAAMNLVRMVTISGQTIDARLFWRACARALRSGSARTQTRDRQVIRMRADETGLVITGAMRAKLSFPVFDLLRAKRDERPRAVGEFLARFDLTPADYAIIEQQALEAADEYGLVLATETAEELSVVVYEEGLQDTRPDADLDFGPPSATRLLHHLRLGEMAAEGPVDIEAVWEIQRSTFGAVCAFRRLAGLPIDLGAAIAAEPDSETAIAQISELDEPFTPMMRLHLARALNVAGKPGAAIGQLNTLMTSLKGNAEVFCAALSWSEKAFEADEAWPSLGPAQKLAVIWDHAERLTRVILKGNLDYESAIQFFKQTNGHRAVGVMLQRGLDIELDCSVPLMMSPIVLAYHGLGYVAGDAPVSEIMDEATKHAFAIQAICVDGESVKPAARLVLRTEQSDDALGSFLRQVPVGLFDSDEDLDPRRVRASDLAGAMERLRTNANDAEAWIWVSVMGRGLVTEFDRTEIDRAFDAVDPWIVGQAESRIDVFRIIVETARQLGQHPDDELIARKLRELAVRCASEFPPPPPIKDDAPAHPFEHLFEAAASAARSRDAEEGLERLHRFTMLIMDAWPAAAGCCREFFDALVRRSPPRDGAVLWRTFMTLRAWP